MCSYVKCLRNDFVSILPKCYINKLSFKPPPGHRSFRSCYCLHVFESSLSAQHLQVPYICS